MADKALVCRDCGEEFLFTDREQEFFAEKGFTNEPSRCPDCRKAKKQNSRRGGGFGQNSRQERKLYPAVCAECGESTEVPFKPSGEKPVYCRQCFQKR